MRVNDEVGVSNKIQEFFCVPERRMLMLAKRVFFISVIFLLVIGCAGVPVRERVKVDFNLPIGKIQGSQFTGIRYPFNVSAPPGWEISMTYPAFMVELGYEKPGLEESQVFVYNPKTQSNLQIEFVPAGQHVVFSQASIEWLTSSTAGGLVSDVKDDFGVPVDLSATEPISLKGVQYAAKKYGTYTVKDVKREQGWIYAFTEPYQIFILYMIFEKEGSNDRQDLKTILDSFEAVSKK